MSNATPNARHDGGRSMTNAYGWSVVVRGMELWSGPDRGARVAAVRASIPSFDPDQS